MLERKIFLLGFGGNRYEITLEELKKQAYEGKIKRDDKVVVWQKSDGQATEQVVLCKNIAGLERLIIRGEAERAVEKRRKAEEKEVAKLAREKEREEAKAKKEEERIVAQKEQDERERLERERILEAAKEKEEKVDSKSESGDPQIESLISLNSIKDTVNFLIGGAVAINVLSLIGYLCFMSKVSDEIELGALIGVLLTAFITSAEVAFLKLPLRIGLFQLTEFKKIIAEANVSVKSREADKEKAPKSSSLNEDETIESESEVQQDSTLETVPVPPLGS